MENANRTKDLKKLEVSTSRGFLGLTQLQDFVEKILDDYVNSESDEPIVLDFSNVKMFDVSAILWLVIGLYYYRRNKGFKFFLRLPKGDGSKENPFTLTESYLRRWRADRAFRCIEADVKKLLIDEQQDYFDSIDENVIYKSREIETDTGAVDYMNSIRLLEILELSDPYRFTNNKISKERINECIRIYDAKRIADILFALCNIEKSKAVLFSKNLINEALLNVEEHPNASIGFIAISINGAANELILSVVDNGDSIPSTIFERFKKDTNRDGSDSYKDIDNNYSVKEKAEIINHATKKGVTRKTNNLQERNGELVETGMGLTYIKDGCINTFSGNLIIITDGCSVRYKNESDSPESIINWKYPWKGNLIRIAIPIMQEKKKY